ncbi:hypothetical protein [Paenibacillus wynnii]|uniref:hypothetical protein n=1 Tax=Paenibacillus wynnii TaxID=268407 RepID=UPI0027907265|nr:hypothetical protein [Paenibacillus wynnii]MDQ0195800.1 hypothetical protein [Paenibacillus wynnii]
MESPATSMALVPITAVTVWQDVNSQWDRLNQNFNRASNNLNDLQTVLERIYEEKNKSFMEGFTRAQEAAQKLSSRTGGSDDEGASPVKKGFLGKADKILKALDVSAFEVITYIGEKAVGYILSRRKEAAAAVAAGGAVSGVSASSGTGSEADSPRSVREKQKKPGILSKTMDSLGSLDVGGIFAGVKSLGEKILGQSEDSKYKKSMEDLQGNMNGALEAMGQKATAALTPVLDMLNNAFKSGQMTQVLNFMANVFMVITTVIGLVIEGLFFMMGVIQQNWDVVGPILAAIAFVLLAAMIIQVYALAVAWLAANWPILLIVAAIGLLIYCLQQSGVSVGEAVVAIAAVFGWLKAFIENIVIYFYNIFIIFADFFRNLFIDPVFAVKKLFYDIAINFLNFLFQMAVGAENFAGGFIKAMAEAINFVLKKFKNLTDFLSNIPGFEFLANISPNLLDTTNPHVFSDLIGKAKDMIPEPTSDKEVHNSKKKEFVDYAASVDNASKGAEKLVSNFSSKVNFKKKGDEDKGTSATANNINKVNEVGKINDTVNISSDDLKLLRDLAEIQAIQNFVELAPTVQVTTGDINNAGDIDTIINKIGQKLHEQLLSSAQGVYT